MLDYGKQEEWSNGFGAQQSPVALDTEKAQVTKTAAPLLNWNMDIVGINVSDQQINFQLNGTGHAQIEQRDYTFVQLHFHAPAEHVIDGKQAAMEWHFVFQDAIGQLAVVARMASVGAANEIFEVLLDQFKPATTVTLTKPLNLQTVLPTQGPILRYLGSLTTPPLTEGVRWYIDQTPLTVSEAQLKRYGQLFAQANNRQVQPLNGRPVLKTMLD